MHLIARLCAASTCALCLAMPPAFAQKSLPTAPSIDDTTNEATIVSSARWRDLVTLLDEIGFRGPVDEPTMRAACHEALSRPLPAGVSAADECVSSALAAWDPSAAYFPAESTAWMRRTPDQARNGLSVGLELERATGNGPIRVVFPTAGGSGERGGLRAGDLVVRMDGQAVGPLTIDQLVVAIRQLGPVVRLQVARGPSRRKLAVQVLRERIHAMTVRRLPGTPRAAVLRFLWFEDITVEDFAARVAEILRTTAPPPDTLVIDLRSCGGSSGSSLDAALQLGGAFSTDGTVVARELTRHGELALMAATSAEPRVAMPVAARRWLASVRLEVLVDTDTGREAEVLAQFLREQRGARMFGEHTRGLDGVRTMVNIGEDAQVRIHTGQLISSRRVAWSDDGLVPDVVMPGQQIDLPWAVSFGSAADTALAAVLRSAESP